MRKGGYYVNNTLLGESGQVNGWTSKQVDCKERQGNKGTSGQVNEWTSGQVNKLIVEEDKVTRGQVDKLDEWTSERVDCEERQSNRGTGVSTYNIWGEKGLKKARD